MLTYSEARNLASQWHSGQGSPFYSFVSTGELHFPLKAYLEELEACLPNIPAELLPLDRFFRENCQDLSGTTEEL